MDLNIPEFYFGREFDFETKKADPEKPVFYDPEDLTTHMVITGMTGSGKTGMGIILLEEAALKGIPAILIDPKGDLTNTLLHFPNMMPADFTPWVDKDAARRDGKTPEEAGTEASASWRKGLLDTGIDKARVMALTNKVDRAIYSPGSDAAIPVSILSSLKAPIISWEENQELLRENISSTVAALLGLIGLKNLDPVRSREHILLSNILEFAWSQGKDLNLESLILQVQNPPFDKLGVFPVSKMYPEKDRFDLAMQLNNFLAAPAFATWLQGQPLDIGEFLYTPEGKPRHSVFYLAHLSDAERMFFVTLLYSAIETWTRAQSGTTNLRALVYFDEIVGYLPPVQTTPAKPIILRLFKQARAFGVGLVVATQNPIDLDYKALSNTGTWMIGRLQTEQDKRRLLDGLDSVSGTFDRAYFDKTISSLPKRVFLLHNINAKKPLVFSTRWAMNYLPGPIMRNRLDELNKLVGTIEEDMDWSQTDTVVGASRSTQTNVSENEIAGSGRGDLPGNPTEPILASRVAVHYLPMNLTLSQALRDNPVDVPATAGNALTYYKPALLGQAKVYYASRTYGLNVERQVAIAIHSLEGRGLVQWQDYKTDPVDATQLENRPLPNSSFGDLVYPFDDEKNIESMQKDFVEWIYRSNTLKLYRSEKYKMTSEPDESQEDFTKRVSAANSSASSDAVEKIRAKFEKQKKTIETRLMKEQMELDKDQTTLNQRKMEEGGSWLSTAARTFLGGKGGLVGNLKRGGSSINSNLTKRRMTSTAKANVDESNQMIELYTQQLAELDQQMEAEIAALQENTEDISASIREVVVTPQKKDIVVEVFGLGWLPNYAFKGPKGWVLVPAD
jgi:hypothetical protein